MQSQQTTPPQGIRLFLDSASPTQWSRFLPLGLFCGITTNPLLLQRAEQPCSLAHLEKLTAAAANLGVGEIHLQVWGSSVEEMFHTGSRLALMAGLGINVMVKVPATEMGYQVANRLAEAGARITITAVHTPGQVLLAAGFGASYVAPYFGRLADARKPARALVLAMDDILKYSSSSTKLLVASLRKASQVVDLAQQGLDTFTVGPEVANELLASPLTDKAVQQFQSAAESTAPDG